MPCSSSQSVCTTEAGQWHNEKHSSMRGNSGSKALILKGPMLTGNETGRLDEALDSIAHQCGKLA